MSTAKLPLGSVHPHVKASKGGDTNLMKFYCTTSASAHGAHFANFQPHPGRHTGTGYQANLRPTVQYTGRLDQVDNPAMGRIVAGNYRTVFQRDFNPYAIPTGLEPLPLTAHQVPTGFVRDAMLMPMQRRRQGPPQALTRAATVAGPSEYREKFTGRPLEPVDLARSDVGPKERTGFTNNAKLIEPVRHTLDSAHRNEKPGWMTHRPTGVSTYTTGYRQLEVPNGREPLPHLADRGSRDSGFSSGTVLLPPFAHRNMADATQQRLQAQRNLTILLIAVIFVFLCGQVPRSLLFKEVFSSLLYSGCPCGSAYLWICCPIYRRLHPICELIYLICLNLNFFIYFGLNEHFRYQVGLAVKFVCMCCRCCGAKDSNSNNNKKELKKDNHEEDRLNDEVDDADDMDMDLFSAAGGTTIGCSQTTPQARENLTSCDDEGEEVEVVDECVNPEAKRLVVSDL